DKRLQVRCEAVALVRSQRRIYCLLKGRGKWVAGALNEASPVVRTRGLDFGMQLKADVAEARALDHGDQIALVEVHHRLDLREFFTIDVLAEFVGDFHDRPDVISKKATAR